MFELDTLPYKTFVKILKSGDSSILGDNHKELWEKLYAEWKELDPNGENKKVFDLHKQINVLEFRQKILALTVEGLKFDNNPEFIEILKNIGYKFNPDDYENEVNRLDRSIKSINPKIAQVKSRLPKKQGEISVDEIIISYCSILGVSYDTNTVTVTQFYGLQKNVENKLKSLKNAK